MTNAVNTEGRCLCGKVNVSIDGPVLMTAQCHCKDCQRMTGSGHASNAFFTQDSVTVTGETNSFTVKTDSGNDSTRHFCPTCSSRVYGTNSGRAGMMVVPVGILEDRSWFKPMMIAYCRNRDDWDKTDTSVPNLDTMPPPA